MWYTDKNERNGVYRMLCCIFGAFPDDSPVNLPENALLIAADGGFRTLERLGRQPDLTVGDFDSLGYVPEGPVLRHPVEKDDTDTMLAVREGLRRGCDTFLLYGGIGGRLDHTVANLQTLAFIRENGAHGFLCGGGYAVTLIREEALTLPAVMSGTLSVFACGGDACGVTLQGLYYPLTEGTLTPAFPIGVSNSFTGAPVRVSVRKGSLLVMWELSACGPEQAAFEAL